MDIRLPSIGRISNWISKYKENCYKVVERKWGQTTMTKVMKRKEKDTEKIKRSEEEKLYLKVELEYSKKLRAVV